MAWSAPTLNYDDVLKSQQNNDTNYWKNQGFGGFSSAYSNTGVGRMEESGGDSNWNGSQWYDPVDWNNLQDGGSFFVRGDRRNDDGSITGGNEFSNIQYKRVGNQLVPVNNEVGHTPTFGESYGSDLRTLAIPALAAGGLGYLAAGGAGAGAGAAAAGYAPATNAALAESAVGTAGYGASSAGAGGGALGLGGATSYAADAGSQNGFNFADLYGQPTQPGDTLSQLASNTNDIAGAAGDTGAGFTPDPYDAHLSNMGGTTGNTLGNMGTAGTVGGVSSMAEPSILDKLWQGITSQGGQTATKALLPSLLSSGASLYTNTQQKGNQQNLANSLQSMYSQDSPYAQQLQNTLARKDAAAGRTSQYGPRLAQFQAQLAAENAKLAPTLSSIYDKVGQSQNGQVNAGINAVTGLVNSMGGMQNTVDGVKNFGNTIADWWRG